MSEPAGPIPLHALRLFASAAASPSSGVDSRGAPASPDLPPREEQWTRLIARVAMLALLFGALGGLAVLARWYRINHGPPSHVTGVVLLRRGPLLPGTGRLQAEAIRFVGPFGPPTYVHRLSQYDEAGALIDRTVLPGRQPRLLTLAEVGERLMTAGLIGEALALLTTPGPTTSGLQEGSHGTR